MKDYYQILGVSDSATAQEIKGAYQQLATRCHPDGGGNHEEMLGIVEASQILGDRALRAAYDFARAHQDNRNAQEAAEGHAQVARRAAETYPRDWESFAKVLGDDETKQADTNSEVPRVKCSPEAENGTRWVFIAIGAVIGAAIGGVIVVKVLGITHYGVSKMTGFLFGAIGAGVGAFIHECRAGSGSGTRN